MEDEENFLRVLGISVIALTKLFLPSMIEKKKGKIMIISSVAAFAPPSSIQSLYGPIKTFMNRFSDADVISLIFIIALRNTQVNNCNYAVILQLVSL